MAITLNSFRHGAVGFIDWLDALISESHGKKSVLPHAAATRLWIPTGEQSGLLTPTAATENVSLCARMKS